MCSNCPKAGRKLQAIRLPPSQNLWEMETEGFCQFRQTWVSLVVASQEEGTELKAQGLPWGRG